MSSSGPVMGYLSPSLKTGEVTKINDSSLYYARYNFLSFDFTSTLLLGIQVLALLLLMSQPSM